MKASHPILSLQCQVSQRKTTRSHSGRAQKSFCGASLSRLHVTPTTPFPGTAILQISCHQPPLVTALLLPEPGALVCRSGPSAGVAGAPGVAQVWSLTSWCPLLKDDLPPPRQNLASHTWRSVLPVLRRRTNVSQLGSEISGRPQHWAGVTVPSTGVLTHSFWNTCNKFSLSTEAVVDSGMTVQCCSA